jgi:hypothetical protein
MALFANLKMEILQRIRREMCLVRHFRAIKAQISLEDGQLS